MGKKEPLPEEVRQSLLQRLRKLKERREEFQEKANRWRAYARGDQESADDLTPKITEIEKFLRENP